MTVPVLILAGAVYLMHADQIAEKLAGGEAEEEFRGTLLKESFQEIAFSDVAIFLVIQALSRLGEAATGLVIDEFEWSQWTTATFCGALVQLTLGLFLLFKARGLVDFLKKCGTAAKRATQEFRELGKVEEEPRDGDRS